MLSVIIPFYNSLEALPKCIESVIAQTYNNIDILLIDDGSEDDSLLVAQKYADIDERIKVFHKENEGVSSARNYGMDNLKTRYFCFIDSDDYVDQNYCKDLMSSNADIVISGFKNVYFDGIRNCHSLSSDGLQPIVYYNNNFKKIFDNNLTNSPCMRRFDQRISEGLRFKKEQYIGEDFIFNLDYINKCKTIELINKEDYFYVHLKKTATGTYHSSDLLDQVRLYDSILNYSKKHNIADGKDVADESICLGGLYSINNLYYSDEKNKYKKKEIYKWLNERRFIEGCSKSESLSKYNQMLCFFCNHRFKKMFFFMLFVKKIAKKIKTILNGFCLYW